MISLLLLCLVVSCVVFISFAPVLRRRQSMPLRARRTRSLRAGQPRPLSLLIACVVFEAAMLTEAERFALLREDHRLLASGLPYGMSSGLKRAHRRLVTAVPSEGRRTAIMEGIQRKLATATG